jgi:hypothetical protein
MNWNWSTIAAVASAITAIVAVLITFYTVRSQRQEKQQKIQVECSISLLTYGPGEVSDPVVMLRAKNPGRQTVTLSVSGFFLPQKKTMSFLYPQSTVTFPYELLPEKSCQVWMDLKNFSRQLHEEGFYGEMKLTGFYRDLVGRTYKSKKWKFNPDIWAKDSDKR